MVRFADTLRGDVVVPRLISTGVVTKIADDTCDVDIDHSLDTELIEICTSGEVYKLRWNSRQKIGKFLYIAKAWRSWNGKRHFRVQCHRLFDDGVIWWREILFETRNGRVVKSVKNHDAIRHVVAAEVATDTK